MYVCHADNEVGSISSSASVRVEEPPVISVKAQARYRVPAGRSVKLDCFVTGNPRPTVFWTRERDPGVLWYPGTVKNNVSMLRNNSLVLASAAAD